MNNNSTTDQGRKWTLQGEAFSRTGDKPREKVPPTTELRLYSVEL